MDTQEGKIRERSSLYPGVSWNEALDFVKNAEELGNKQISYNSLANYYNLNSVQTKSFQAKLSSAKQFSLVTTGDQVIQITEIAKRLLYPTNIEETRKIEVKCINSPPLYKKLIERFQNKALPAQNVLENILLNEYSIAKNAKSVAASCFLKSIEQLAFAQAGVLVVDDNAKTQNSQHNIPPSTIQQKDTYLPNIQKKSDNDDNKINDFFKFEVTLRNGKNVLLYLPNDAEKEDAEMIWDMLGVILKRRFGINT